MSRKQNAPSQAWTILGIPAAGTISALAIAQEDGESIFVGTRVGLYRSVNNNGVANLAWERLSNTPLGILCLAVSPDFAEDHTLLAGTSSGIFYSRDRGETWQAAQMPISGAMILTICFSPNYGVDGMILAGTLEDGIFFSDTRGERWWSKAFGLLDPSVYAIAFSPGFAQDETIYAGTDTALYYSYNSARAWKELGFPQDSAPILSLALSPHFSADQTLFAGTDAEGIFRSTDRGKTWEKLPLPAASVSVILFSQDGMRLTVATEEGIYLSKDRGETWECLVNLPGVISMVAQQNLMILGLVDQGAWMTADYANWQPVTSLPARLLVNMVISPTFEQDRLAFLHGPQEGIWRTKDGGHTWEGLSEQLHDLDINSLALSPHFSANHILLATSSDGVLLSEDTGDNWRLISSAAANLAAFSPNGKLLSVSFPGEGLCITDDLGKTWEKAPGPWDSGGEVLALAVANSGVLYVALLEGIGETISIWQGAAGEYKQALSTPAHPNPVVTFWIPPDPAADRPWFAAYRNKVWKFSTRRTDAFTETIVFSEQAVNESVLSLTGDQSETGLQTKTGQILFACTGQHIYKMSTPDNWQMAHDFGDERVVSFELSPRYSEDKIVYALMLGGAFCRGNLR